VDIRCVATAGGAIAATLRSAISGGSVEDPAALAGPAPIASVMAGVMASANVSVMATDAIAGGAAAATFAAIALHPRLVESAIVVIPGLLHEIRRYSRRALFLRLRFS
jgi:hypothetical protein